MKRIAWIMMLLPCMAVAQQTLVGNWLVTIDLFGNPLPQKLSIQPAGNTLAATMAGRKVELLSAPDGHVHFLVKDENNGTAEFTGTFDGKKMTGTAHTVNFFSEGEDTERAFTAVPILDRNGPPQRHEFTPTKFERQFSASTKPVLTIWPGDTVHTTTVDAGGADEKGVRRVLGGNPETGPFYVESAMPGDVLAVHFNRIRLNRDWAQSDDAVVGRATGPQFAVKMKDLGKTVRWHLDRERGVATTEKPGDHLKSFTVPLRPMMGCVAVAPGFASAPPPTGDSGDFGGNMDFNEIVEGSTVYLPVRQPGALLYVGDGHAAQGDGELNGNALETSMDVEFTVEVIHGKPIFQPRVETPTHIIAMGLAGSLDTALQLATAGLASWLEQDYKLTPSEIAQVLGTSTEYKISEVADRNAGIVAMLSKERLATLTRGDDHTAPAKP